MFIFHNVYVTLYNIYVDIYKILSKYDVYLIKLTKNISISSLKTLLGNTVEISE